MNPAASKAPALDPIQLVLGASGVVLVVLALLAVASVLVWLIWFLKTAQLGRLRSAERNSKARHHFIENQYRAMLVAKRA